MLDATSLDFTCGPAQAQPIAAAITGAQLVLLPGRGHIPGIGTPPAIPPHGRGVSPRLSRTAIPALVPTPQYRKQAASRQPSNRSDNVRSCRVQRARSGMMYVLAAACCAEQDEIRGPAEISWCRSHEAARRSR